MSNLLPRLLRSAERSDVALVTADQLAEWPVTEQEWCIGAQVLVDAGAPRELQCHNCAEQSLETIVFTTGDSSKVPVAFLPCPVCGPQRVTSDRLKQWRVDFPRLGQLILETAGVASPWRELIPCGLWHCGRAHWAGSSWDVLVGRGLGRSANRAVLKRLNLSTRSLVFLAAQLDPLLDCTTAIPLESVVTWKAGLLEFHEGALQEQLAPASRLRAARHSARPARKRSARAATIELLARHLKEHLRAAADYARVTADRNGLAELLPRPTQRDLARLAGTSEVAVSRCLKDPAARELRLLWATADDLESVLRLGSRGG